jgi:amidase
VNVIETEDLTKSSAMQLMEHIKTGRISCADLLEMYLKHARKYNTAINAIVEINAPMARQRAKQADEALDRGEWWGPLHGLPITIKDVFLVKGFKIACGTTCFEDVVVMENADVVQKLIDAGANIYAKTNLPFFAGDWQTYNRVYGTTNNPYDLSKTCGGSSGGAAASVAAGFSALELGSDLGGSVRIPAHFCGVYGFRPTYGVTSMYGHVPGNLGDRAVPDMSSVGLLCKTAEDLNMLLDIVAGAPDPERRGVEIVLPRCAKKTLGEFKVIAWMDDDYCKINQKLSEKYEMFLSLLEQEGVSVTRKKPDGYSLEETYALMRNLTGSVISTGLGVVQQIMLWILIFLLGVIKKSKLSIGWRGYFQGIMQSHRKWLALNEKRMRTKHRYMRLFDSYDLLIMPVAPWTAFVHDHRVMTARKIMVNGQKRSYTEHIPWIAIPTVYGFPAASTPIGFDDEGMPVNIQVVGGPYDDKAVIRFGELVDSIKNKMCVDAQKGGQ